MVNENSELKLRLQAMEQQAKLREGEYTISVYCQTISHIHKRGSFFLSFLVFLSADSMSCFLPLFPFFSVYVALNETLSNEVQRLKLASREMSGDSHVPSPFTSQQIQQQQKQAASPTSGESTDTPNLTNLTNSD
jgi:hypothetical protein